MTSASPAVTVVLGARGKTGRRVVDRFQQAGLPVRGASRSSAFPFDWQDRATWRPVLDGARAAYITFYPDLALPGAADTVGDFVDLAVASGVRRLVLLSGRGEEGAQGAEKRLQESGADWTVVRCAFFNQNFSETFAEAIRHGVIAMPAGETREPFLDADDIADVVFAVLTEDGHQGQLYELTGPRLLGLADVAAELGQAIGREVRYVPLSPADYAEQLMEHGMPPSEAKPIAGLIASVLDGRNESLEDGVQRALGRAPRDFSDFARAAAAAGAWKRAS
ncbi:MAG: NAD(P)H-binding protein [Acidobacteriota bacterium]